VANRADQAGTSEEWAIRVAAAALRAFGARTPAASQAAATGKGAQNPWGGFLSAFGETRDRREDAQNTVGGVLRIFDETREILIEAHK
jgi:hypothetical protein